MKYKLLLFLCFAIMSFPLALGLEECGGIMTSEDIPCLVFLPVQSGCANVTISFYMDNTFIETNDMDTYTPFYCNATFTYTTVGTYVFDYSTGDTGSIILEEDKMLNIFQLGVYGFMFFLGLVFMVFMHVFKEDAGSSVVYGGIATAIFSIMGAMLVSGFELVRGVTFFFDINYYLVGLSFAIAIYTLIVSVNLWRIGRPKERGMFE